MTMRKDAGSRSTKRVLATLVTLWGLAPALHAGPPGNAQDWITLSALVAAPAADARTQESRASLTVPDCPSGTEFLVLGVAGGPAVVSFGDTLRSAEAGPWAVFARIVQRTSSGLAQPETRLVAYGNGLAYASATLPAGQPAGSSSASTQLVVGVLGLPSYRGAGRFRIDVTGACGTYSVR
jgi:hypothetical protein